MRQRSATETKMTPANLPVHDGRSGVTLLEVIVGSVFIVLLATISLPVIGETMEKRRASEAFCYLDDIANAQEEYRSLHGHYADELDQLNLPRVQPVFYSVGSLNTTTESADRTSWSLTLTRDRISSGDDTYTITYNERGFDRLHSTADRILSRCEVL